MHASAARKLNGTRDMPDLRKTPFQRTFISFTSGARKFIEAYWILSNPGIILTTMIFSHLDGLLLGKLRFTG